MFAQSLGVCRLSHHRSVAWMKMSHRFTFLNGLGLLFSRVLLCAVAMSAAIARSQPADDPLGQPVTGEVRAIKEIAPELFYLKNDAGGPDFATAILST